jgi:hypothetical protein
MKAVFASRAGGRPEFADEPDRAGARSEETALIGKIALEVE